MAQVLMNCRKTLGPHLKTTRQYAEIVLPFVKYMNNGPNDSVEV